MLGSYVINVLPWYWCRSMRIICLCLLSNFKKRWSVKIRRMINYISTLYLHFRLRTSTHIWAEKRGSHTFYDFDYDLPPPHNIIFFEIDFNIKCSVPLALHPHGIAYTFLKLDLWSARAGFIPIISIMGNKSDKKEKESFMHTNDLIHFLKDGCNSVWLQFHVFQNFLCYVLYNF